MKKWSAVAVAMFLALAVPPTLDAHEDLAPASEFKATDSDGPAYPVSGIRLEISSSAAGSPVLSELGEFKVTLGQVVDGFVGPQSAVRQTQVRLISAPYSNYYASALSAITLQLSDHLKSQGFEGVIVYPLEEEIDPETGRDLRGVGHVNLTLLVRGEPRKKKRWLF